MMNVDERILMEAIEVRTRQEMRQRHREEYPDDYFDEGYDIDTMPLRTPTPTLPLTPRMLLKPDELALHQQLLEIAKSNAPAPSESFFG